MIVLNKYCVLPANEKHNQDNGQSLGNFLFFIACRRGRLRFKHVHSLLSAALFHLNRSAVFLSSQDSQTSLGNQTRIVRHRQTVIGHSRAHNGHFGHCTVTITRHMMIIMMRRGMIRMMKASLVDLDEIEVGGSGGEHGRGLRGGETVLVVDDLDEHEVGGRLRLHGDRGDRSEHRSCAAGRLSEHGTRG